MKEGQELNLIKEMIKTEGWKLAEDAVNSRIIALKDELVDCKDADISPIRANIRGLKEAIEIIKGLAEPPAGPEQLPVETDIGDSIEKKP